MSDSNGAMRSNGFHPWERRTANVIWARVPPHGGIGPERKGGLSACGDLATPTRRLFCLGASFVRPPHAIAGARGAAAVELGRPKTRLTLSRYSFALSASDNGASSSNLSASAGSQHG